MTPRYRLAILQSHPIQYAAPLFRYLAKQPDLDLTVYFCSHQGAEAYLDEGFGSEVRWDVPLLEGYRYRFLSNLRSGDGVGGFFSLINPAMMAELYRNRPDALWVHGHNYATNLMAILAARLLRIPVLMRGETHLLLTRSPARRLLRIPVMGLLYRYLCQACLPIGSRNRAFYRSLGVPVDHLFDVPYAVDNDFFMTSSAAADRAALRQSLGLEPDMTVFLYASKLTARKRPSDLLAAYHLVRRQRDDVALVLVGSGEEEEKLRREVEKEAIPQVHFLGFRNQTELPGWMAAADVFVLPSQDEPWGLVINEAMCASLPVVASDQVGAAEDLVVPGETGLIFPAGDVARLANCLETLAADRESRCQMGRRAADRIATWDFAACTRGIREALAAVSNLAESTLPAGMP